MGEEGRLGRMGPAVCVMVRPSLDGIWQRDDIIYIYIYIYIYIMFPFIARATAPSFPIVP